MAKKNALKKAAGKPGRQVASGPGKVSSRTKRPQAPRAPRREKAPKPVTPEPAPATATEAPATVIAVPAPASVPPAAERAGVAEHAATWTPEDPSTCTTCQRPVDDTTVHTTATA